MYGFIGKIQGSEQVAVFPLFYLCQYFLGGDLVEVFVLVVIENATVVEQSKTYQVAKTIWQIVHILKIEDKVFRVVFKA